MTQPLDRSLLIKGLKVLEDDIKRREQDYKELFSGVEQVIIDMDSGSIGDCSHKGGCGGCLALKIRERLERLVQS